MRSVQQQHDLPRRKNQSAVCAAPRQSGWATQRLSKSSPEPNNNTDLLQVGGRVVLTNTQCCSMARRSLWEPCFTTWYGGVLGMAQPRQSMLPRPSATLDGGAGAAQHDGPHGPAAAADEAGDGHGASSTHRAPPGCSGLRKGEGGAAVIPRCCQGRCQCWGSTFWWRRA